MTSWRIIQSGHCDGPWNMSADEAIMGAVACGEQPPTLRLYGWQPHTLTLGYHQPFGEGIDANECARRGFDIERRPTGGRAILHAHELTYSVCIRQDQVRGGESVMRSYREISRGIIAGLALLGAGVSLGDDGDGRRDAAPAETVRSMCFAKTARCDLQAAGRKVVGSAQVRRDGAILQHGSIPLTLDLQAQAAVMPGERAEIDSSRALADAAMSVSELLGRPVSFEELGDAVASGFAAAMDATLAPADFSPDEQAAAEKFRAEKYGDPDFTRRM